MWLNKISILSVILLAAFFRLISLNQSLWWDEAINVVYARQSDLWWFITKYPLGDFHPPGWFFILWVWGHLFGWSEVSVRMPSVLLGIGTVYITYLIAKELFSRKVGLLAALMLSLAPLHIYYSQEARMYALSAFAVSLSIYSLIRLLRNDRYSLLIYLLSSALVLYSDYVAYFIFPTQLIYVFLFQKQYIKTILLSLGLSVMLFSPWLFIFPNQLTAGQNTAILIPGWKEVVGGSSLKELVLLPVKTLMGRVSLENSLLYLLLIAVLASPFLFVFTNVKKVFDNKYYLILFWLIFTPVLVWIFSYIVPVFSYFRLLYILPAFYIAAAVCLVKFSNSYFKMLLGLILFFELSVSCLYLFDNNFQREDWRGAIDIVTQNIDKQTLVVFENTEIPAAAKYYSNNLTNFEPGLADDFESKFLNVRKVYLFEYLADVYDPERSIEQKIKGMNFIEINTYNFIGVGFVRVYTKM
ncbi:MAG: glycosyltransferase family 39 protein [Microgenomates group bacterium]|jgi:uncharacterized membrane protein